MKRDHLLPLGLRQSLSAFGERLVSGPAPDGAILERILTDIEDLPADAVSRAAHEINAGMRLGWVRPALRKRGVLDLFLGAPVGPPSERELMTADSRYARLFSFIPTGGFARQRWTPWSSRPPRPLPSQRSRFGSTTGPSRSGPPPSAAPNGSFPSPLPS